MAAIDDLIQQIEDPELRKRIKQEADKLTKTKKFGLVFEDHIPECTPLYDAPIKIGSLVAKKTGKINDTYEVESIEGDIGVCYKKSDSKKEEIPVKDLVCVARFGDPIYPYLQPIDSVCNAPDSDLWHTLIEADNYHALQLLEYLYAGKVDCIYIDPPYNKVNSRDWKYNCNYVDGNDSYRHSKWLAMIEKRLKIAKRLLNPVSSVLIVTIDEEEYLHLGCLLEDMFSEARIQMISSVINHAGTSRTNEFSRINEYIFVVMLGDISIEPLSVNENRGEKILWDSLRRHNPTNIRDAQHPNQFYPIYINDRSKKIQMIGEPIPYGQNINTIADIDGCSTVWPIRDDGTEMMWGVKPSVLQERLSGGFVKVGKHQPNKPQKYSIQFLSSGTIDDIKKGVAQIIDYSEDGSVNAIYPGGKKMMPSNQWDYAHHDARDHGNKIIKAIFHELRFTFPKSPYAVYDTLRLFLENKKEAIVLDFFAGSGTTMHSVNLLNKVDEGNRRCICVTNNELSESESKKFIKKDYILEMKNGITTG